MLKLLGSLGTNKLKLSVVVIFYNMRREARRTLWTLTTNYQQNITEKEYEVIVIDSGSTEPLDPGWVSSLQQNFSYQYVKTRWPAPCEAMNIGIEQSRADTVVCMIDGARMLSPNVLSLMLKAKNIFPASFVYTNAMHIGAEIQNVAVENGYNQAVEDELLNSVDWKEDGYRLFDISCLAGSSRDGFLNPILESNCFAINKKRLQALGGFDERFRSPGGGLVNLDIFNILVGTEDLQVVTLLGEASFHQFHGGVATNVTYENHPLPQYLKEYKAIRNREFEFFSVNYECFYLGTVPENTRDYLDITKNHTE